MEENKNPFAEAATNSSPRLTPERESVYYSKDGSYCVDPNAENVLNGVAVFILIIGIIAAIALLIAGFNELDSRYGEAQGIIYISSGIIAFVVALVQWAGIKVIVNISRSLYNIHNDLKNK